MPQVPPPLPTTPHNEVLVYDLHGDLSGMRIRVEALQQRRPRDSVNIASQQEPPHGQAVLRSVWEDQVVLNILRAVGFSQPSQGSLLSSAVWKGKGLPSTSKQWRQSRAKALALLPWLRGRGRGWLGCRGGPTACRPDQAHSTRHDSPPPGRSRHVGAEVRLATPVLVGYCKVELLDCLVPVDIIRFHEGEPQACRRYADAAK